jgi:hypothetical protein
VAEEAEVSSLAKGVRLECVLDAWELEVLEDKV